MSLESASHTERTAAAANARQALRDAYEAAKVELLEKRRTIDARLPLELQAIDDRAQSVADEIHTEILGVTRSTLAGWARKWRAQPQRSLTQDLADIVHKLSARFTRELGEPGLDGREVVLALADAIAVKTPAAVGAFSWHLLSDQRCLSLAARLIQLIDDPVETERTLLEIESALAELARTRGSTSPASSERWAVICGHCAHGRRTSALHEWTEGHNRAHNERSIKEAQARIDSMPFDPSNRRVNLASQA